MRETFGYELALRLAEQDAARPDRPSVFTLGGRRWDLLDGVFAPIYRPSTSACLELLGLPRDGPPDWRSMLEVGCGTGVIAVLGALAGCPRVLAVDISPSAVRNTAMNAERHGVADRVSAVRSDLFAALEDPARDRAERFDLVFWNSPFVPAPADYAFRADHERGYVDPGYAAHRRFLTQAPRYTSDKGRILLLFSRAKGDLPRLEELAATCGRRLRIVGRHTVPDGPDRPAAEYLLIEVTVG